MIIPNVLMWIAATIAASWKVSQLIRVPRDQGLRVVTVCTVLVFVALSAQLAVSIPSISELFPSQSPKLIQNVILTFFFALLIVLLQSTVSPSRVGSRGYIEVAIALLTSCVLLGTFTAAAPGADGASYGDALANGDPGLVAFYLTGNVYMAYATARGAYLAWTTASHTQSRARLSLRVAAAGLVVCCVGTHLPRVVATSGQLIIGENLLPNTASWTPPLLAIGIAAFFVGIGYPGARTGLVKVRLWFEVRRHYRQLRPLWVAVYDQFPHIALFPLENRTHEILHVRHMRLRYYRRIIECRDGLVCLSPYIEAPIDDSRSSTQQAELVLRALARSSSQRVREPMSTSAVIAAPPQTGMNADIQELLALSCALDRITKEEKTGSSTEK